MTRGVSPSAPPTVMIVDDTVENLRLLQSMLKESGYNVRPAPSGALALRAAAKEPPDLILLDINMPDMNGLETCKRLKQDAALKDIPVIFLSALDETDDKLRAFQAGGVDYVTKPFRFEEIRARVETQLKLRNAQNQIERKNAELARAFGDLERLQARLVQSEKMVALGVLSAGIAGELSIPLGALKANAAGLSRALVPLRGFADATPGVGAGVMAEISELIRRNSEETERAAGILEGLAKFSRMDDGVATSRVAVHEPLEAALALLRHRLGDELVIEREYADLPSILCHAEQVEQVFLNVALLTV